MKRMTLSEAIEHCYEVARDLESEFDGCLIYRLQSGFNDQLPPEYKKCNTEDCLALGDDGKGKGCVKCAEEHRQLAKWLEELRDYRIKNGVENIDE